MSCSKCTLNISLYSCPLLLLLSCSVHIIMSYSTTCMCQIYFFKCALSHFAWLYVDQITPTRNLNTHTVSLQYQKRQINLLWLLNVIIPINVIIVLELSLSVKRESKWIGQICIYSYGFALQHWGKAFHVPKCVSVEIYFCCASTQSSRVQVKTRGRIRTPCWARHCPLNTLHLHHQCHHKYVWLLFLLHRYVLIS